MNKQEKIKQFQKGIAKSWSCPEDIFHKEENVIIETDKVFFEIITFGQHAIIRSSREIVNWCQEHFSRIPAMDIMDGDNFYQIEKKLREYGRRLDGEHTLFLHLNPDFIVEKPNDFIYEWVEKEQMPLLYEDPRFENALNYHYKLEHLALLAKREGEIVAMAAAGEYDFGVGHWEIGIDTLASYRNRGLAAYLIKEITVELEKRSQLSYYTTWTPNLASVRTALKAGFVPVSVWYYATKIHRELELSEQQMEEGHVFDAKESLATLREKYGL